MAAGENGSGIVLAQLFSSPRISFDFIVFVLSLPSWEGLIFLAGRDKLTAR
jgi:hypothetical protein